MKIDLFNDDCFDVFPFIEDKSVDLILTDPPYGTTSCKWDTVIPFEPMWKELKRIIKDNGAICLFGSEPFSSALRMSNIKEFKYDWVWNKNNSCGFALVKRRPFIIHENISVFFKKGSMYYPQMEIRGKIRTKGGYSASDNYLINPKKSKSNSYYPKNILNYSNAVQSVKVHPTQKPVTLLEYLIKTYTLEGETVLDFTMGSGSMGVACKNLKRNFIGIEKEPNYFKIAEKRIHGE